LGPGPAPLAGGKPRPGDLFAEEHQRRDCPHRRVLSPRPLASNRSCRAARLAP